MSIPHAFIEELIARSDIVDVINARVPLRRAGVNYIARCPFHSEKTPSFSVNPNKQFYHCFGCGESGDAIQFLRKYEGLEFVEAVETLASRMGLTIPYETKEGLPMDAATSSFNNAHAMKSKAIYAILAEAAKFYQTQLREHPAAPFAHQYLKNRGLTGQIAKQFGLGFASAEWDGLLKHLGKDQTQRELLVAAGLVIQKKEGISQPASTHKTHHANLAQQKNQTANSSRTHKSDKFFDRFRNRVIFPIRDRRGRVVGFGGRILHTTQQQDSNQHEAKYLNSPETPVFNKGSELYGLYEARVGHPALTSLIVVEGYMDVVSLAQFGILNAVGTLGTALTEKHVDLLFRQVSELVFCFDGDKAGKEAAKRSLPLILPMMKEGRRVRFIRLPEGTDPDSFVRKSGPVAFLELVERAIPLSDFLFETLSTDIDLKYLDGRAQLITLSKPMIELLPRGVFQQMLYDRLAQLTGVNTEIIQGRPVNTMNKTQNPWSKKSAKPRELPPNPAKRALAMLIKNRGLINRVQLEPGKIKFSEFHFADTEGTAELCVMIDILQGDPNIPPERISEKLTENGMSQFSYVELKMIADSIPEDGLEQEFLGALQRLHERAQELAMESLLTKAKTGALSSEEKVHLRNLLAQREKDKSRLTE